MADRRFANLLQDLLGDEVEGIDFVGVSAPAFAI
jgi:hypothetical protein